MKKIPVKVHEKNLYITDYGHDNYTLEIETKDGLRNVHSYTYLSSTGIIQYLSNMYHNQCKKENKKTTIGISEDSFTFAVEKEKKRND